MNQMKTKIKNLFNVGEMRTIWICLHEYHPIIKLHVANILFIYLFLYRLLFSKAIKDKHPAKGWIDF